MPEGVDKTMVFDWLRYNFDNTLTDGELEELYNGYNDWNTVIRVYDKYSSDRKKQLLTDDEKLVARSLETDINGILEARNESDRQVEGGQVKRKRSKKSYKKRSKKRSKKSYKKRSKKSYKNRYKKRSKKR